MPASLFTTTVNARSPYGSVAARSRASSRRASDCGGMDVIAAHWVQTATRQSRAYTPLTSSSTARYAKRAVTIA